ncbi:MAG: vitamin B12 dependent-methionine synthase activation domain-containing protein [Thermodesulfobacteriota bacterium]
MIHMILTSFGPAQVPSGWDGLFQPPLQKEWIDKSLLHMGYPDLTQINPQILEKTHDLSALVTIQAKPFFLFNSARLSRITKTGFEANGLTITSRKWGAVAAMLDTPIELCCFGMTLGDEIETTNKAMSEKSLTQGFVWDALCSTLAEYYADRVEICLARYYKQNGLKITRRFSPGYCDLPLLQAQKAIFRFCDMEAIGIRLSSSGWMTPRKSITGMVLAAENLPVTTPCSVCKRTCPHRRANDEAVQLP